MSLCAVCLAPSGHADDCAAASLALRVAGMVLGCTGEVRAVLLRRIDDKVSAIASALVSARDAGHRDGVAAERERCDTIASEHDCETSRGGQQTAQTIVRRIRKGD